MEEDRGQRTYTVRKDVITYFSDGKAEVTPLPTFTINQLNKVDQLTAENEALQANVYKQQKILSDIADTFQMSKPYSVEDLLIKAIHGAEAKKALDSIVRYASASAGD